jgi:hypothetical protein
MKPNQAGRWTEPEDTELKSLLASGLARSVIAQRLGRPESSIHTRVAHFALKPATKRRQCMCCGNQFSSEGPHNRLCAACRKKQTSPYQP